MRYPITLKHKKSGIIVTFTAPTTGARECSCNPIPGVWVSAESGVWKPVSSLDKIRLKTLKTFHKILVG